MLFLAIPLPSSHPSSPQAWHHSPEETRLLMSSGLAHPGAGLSLPAPFFPSQLLSFPADPVECFPCLPHSPCASLFPFYRGFDHLRLFNPDSKEGKVPFELLPVLCPSTLPESSSAHPLEHPSRTKPSLCRPGLQPAWAAGSAYLQAQPAFQPSAGPLQLSASCQAPEVLFKKFPAPAPTAMNWLVFGVSPQMMMLLLLWPVAIPYWHQPEDVGLLGQHLGSSCQLGIPQGFSLVSQSDYQGEQGDGRNLCQ